MGVTDVNKKFDMTEMAGDDVYFAATGVTEGNFLKGVKFARDHIETHTVVMRSKTGTVRWIEATHTEFSKFHLD